MARTMPAVTLWQPWATLVTEGMKPYEFRNWPAPNRLVGHDRLEHSNWGWPLTDIRRLEPFVPARGAQGFWNWTPSGA